MTSNNKNPTKINPAKIIDHTNIDDDATKKDIKKLCDEAKKYGFRGVCVNPEWTSFAKSQVENTDIKVVVLADPPMGLRPHNERMKTAEKVKEEGGDNLDIVMNIIDMKYEKYDDILKDLKPICKVMPTKVIIGSGYLTNNEIKKASELVKEAGAICVKTATEKDPLEHIELEEKAKHIEMMKQHAPGLEVKAAGKIRTYKDLLKMVEAGADIIGTSTSLNIMRGYKASKKTGKVRSQKTKGKNIRKGE